MNVIYSYVIYYFNMYMKVGNGEAYEFLIPKAKNSKVEQLGYRGDDFKSNKIIGGGKVFIISSSLGLMS